MLGYCPVWHDRAPAACSAAAAMRRNIPRNAKYDLSAGDAVYCDSTAPHCYRRVGAKRTTALVVTTNVERAVRPV
jgi:mannose-6-phosphate isomerase-like protein (cupin superfamily)